MDGSGSPPPVRPHEPLFRRAAVDAQQSQWLGTVLALPGLPATAIAVGSLAVAAALLGLLFFTDFTRKARVTGWLAPADGLLRVFAPRPGTILRVHVREGEEVKQGAALLTLSTDVRNATIGAVGAQIVSRLRRQIEMLDASRSLDAALAEAQAGALEQRIVMLDRESAATESEVTVQRARLGIARRAALRQRALREQGLQTEQRLERAKEEELEQAARVHALERRHAALDREVADAAAERAALPLRHARQQAEADRAIAVLEAELAQAEGARELVLSAPQTGTVTSIVADAGDSVATATPVLAILPEGATLQAQLFAPSSAVGFLRPGQVVRLRYAAYPYQKFGHHSGRIAEVSRAALAPTELPPRLAGIKALHASGEPLYRITVTLAAQSVGAYGTAMPLQPGMQLEADIMVERRRLIEWAFDPLYTIAGRWRS